MSALHVHVHVAARVTVEPGVALLPGLLASPSSACSSVHSARECSRQSCRKRACVRLTLFSRDSRATVCSHSFHPLNQLANTPTWSRNIMVRVSDGGRKADRLCPGGATSSQLGTDGRWQQSSLLVCDFSVHSRWSVGRSGSGRASAVEG